MVVAMRGGLWLRLIKYCRGVFPAEACGFVIGDVDKAAGCMTADDFVPIRNAAQFPERRFQMEPVELAARLAETPQIRLLGIFHSHPRTAPVPSALDLQTAWYTLPSYWIVSLQDMEHPSLAVYRLERRDGDVVPVPLPFQQKEHPAWLRQCSANNDDGSAVHTDRLK